MKIGFNSGVLRKCGMSLKDTILTTRKEGATVFELCFRSPESLLRFELTEEIEKLLSEFEHLSIHAPFNLDENLKYQDNKLTKDIVWKLKELVDRLGIEGIVFHPTDIEDFDFLDTMDLPILVENMDVRKSSFKNMKDIKTLKEKYGFGFVLDIEHSFENDSSMELTKDLIDIMGDRLKEVHLSGAKNSSNITGNNHCLLMETDYRDSLFKFLKDLKDVPIVLESTIEKGFEEKLGDELNCVRDFLNED